MKVIIVMGSSSDKQVMKGAADALELFGIEWEARILSAHRVPEELKQYVERQVTEDAACFIAGAGLAAHLPGVIASFTTLPVIGVPLRAAFDGMDALMSIVQMPRGVPVATVGVNNSFNAGLLAVQILAVHVPELKEKLAQFRRERAESILNEPKNREVFND
ncbi:MAG: 5-(carboxyamino)imidazole ribonucleotide mutase [Sediminispirochaetaceae bacterium]